MIFRTAILTAACLPGLAWAVDELNYSYVEAGYETGQVDRSGLDVDFDKTGGTASYDLTENFAVFGTGLIGEVETMDIGAPRNIDTRELSAGMTAHFPLYDRIDFVMPIAVEYARARAGRIIESETGYSIAVGVRALLSDQIEVDAAIKHVDIKDSDQSLVSNVRYHFSEAISASLSGAVGGDADSLGIGARFSF